MTAYEIIQQHPEWAEKERTPRAAIQNAARRYVRELEGSKNFCSLITEDLDDLLGLRDTTNDFAGIVADGSKAQVSTESPEYLADKRKAQIYAIFVKAIISELSGKAICTAAKVDQWRERYGVKLEGMKGKPAKVSAKPTKARLNPIDKETLETVYNSCKYLSCARETFLSYFSEQGIGDREPLTWKGAKYQFAIFWKGICKLAGKNGNTPWELSNIYFKHDFEDLAGAYKSAKKKLPKGFDRMESIFEEIEKSKKDDEISQYKKEGVDEYLNNMIPR